MANRPASAGAHSAGAHSAGAHSAGPRRGPAAAPPPVHHQGFPRSPRIAPARPAALAWLPYLIVLAGVAVGLFVIWQGSQYAGPGAGLVGGALLVAAVTRLVLPPRYAGLLASRGRALDVATYAVLGAAVLGVALSLP